MNRRVDVLPSYPMSSSLARSGSRVAAVLGLWVLGACGVEQREVLDPLPAAGVGDLSDASTGGETEAMPASESGSEDASADEAHRLSGGEERLDLGVPTEQGCTKIDFLFVIDDSGSMADEQARLVEGFPGFIDAIGAAIEQYDYHVMVVTTGLHPGGADACEGQAGVGRVVDGDQSECDVLGGRFLDGGQEEIAETFTCIASVGTEGSGSELPIWAMTQAVTTHAQAGGCNEGFLRDDAVLVVTMITDEEDELDSPGDPEIWHEVMVAAKHGDEEAVVVLSLIGDTDLPDATCQRPEDAQDGTGAQAAPRLREFTESFPYGSWASVCLDDYAPFFNDAVNGIGEACHDFIPPG